MKRVFQALGALLLLLTVSLPMLIGWVIATQAGNGVLLHQIAPLIGASISVGERDGDISGSLEWRQISYEDRHVRVGIQQLRLSWKPLKLWDGLVSVQNLEANGLDVHLKPSTAGPKSSNQPPPADLPVNIRLDHLHVTDLSYWGPDAHDPILLSRIEFAGSWIGKRVTVQSLEADSADIGHTSLQAEADLSRKGVDLSKLQVSAPVQASAQGFIGYDSASDLKLDWRDLRWPLPGVLGAAADAPAQVTSAQGKATLKGRFDDLQFSLAAALGADGQVQMQGHWNGQLDTQAQWTGLAWPMVPPSKPAPPAAANPAAVPASPAATYRSAQGRLDFKGLPAAYAFDVDANLVAQQQSGHVSARGSGSLQSVDLGALKISVGKAQAEAAGKLAWAPQPAGALTGSVRHLDPSVFLPEWPGDINGEFSVNGEVARKQDTVDPALDFSLALHDSTLRTYPLALDAQGRYARQVLDLAKLELHSGDSLLTASGRATEPYDLQAQLTSPHMNELAPGLAGSLQAKAHFRGSLKAPVLIADAELEHAVWQDYAVASLNLSTDLDWNGPMKLDAQARDLSAGNQLASVDLHGEGTRMEHRIQVSATSHDVRVELNAAGGWDERRKLWEGQLRDGRVTPTQLPSWSLQQPAPLLLSAGRNDVGPACWTSDPGRVCLQAHQSAASTRADLQLEQLGFQAFKSLMPADMVMEGQIDGKASAELANGQLRQASAELTTSAGSLQLGERHFKFLPASLTLTDAPEQGQIELKLPLEVGGIEGEARIAPGAVLADRVLSGEIRLDFPDLAFLAVLSNEISSASGKLAGTYQIAGKVAAPELQGEVRLSDGKMKLTRPGIELDDLTAVVSGDPNGGVHMVADAKSGGGTLHVDGQVLTGPLAVEPVSGAPAPNARHQREVDPAAAAAADAAAVAPPVEKTNANAAAVDTKDASGAVATPSTQPPPPEVLPSENNQGLKLVVQVDGSGFQVADTTKMQIWASPDLRFTLSGKEASLKGTLTVPRADIKLEQGQGSGVAPSSDQVIVDAAGKVPERVESFSLATEVKLVLGKDVKLEGYGLKTKLEGAVTAVDQPGRDTLGYGELHLEDGHYQAYGQDLDIETGKLLFNGGPIAKPGLEIRAARKETDDVTVGIYVRGSLEKPLLSLYSSPTMTQQEQLSWLIFSQPLAQSTTSSQDRGALGGAAVALGLGGGTLLAQSLQKGLGLDSISFGSDPGETQEQARFTVGKYLSPKIFVSYGIGLFQPGQVFKLLYDLGKGFKLSTESGTYTGGDLLYQIEKR